MFLEQDDVDVDPVQRVDLALDPVGQARHLNLESTHHQAQLGLELVDSNQLSEFFGQLELGELGFGEFSAGLGGMKADVLLSGRRVPLAFWRCRRRCWLEVGGGHLQLGTTDDGAGARGVSDLHDAGE